MKDNSFANNAYNDPMFALGQLLGQNWSKNYEDRGRAKALADIEAQLSPNPTKQELADATQKQQVSNETAAKQTLGADPQQVDALTQQYGNIKGKVAGDLLNDPNNFTGNDEFSKYMSNATQDTNNQVQAAQTLGYVPKTVSDAGIAAANDYAGTLKPVISANGAATLSPTQGIGDIAKQSADSRLTNFNADKFIADQTVNLLKKGYSKEDIETMLAPIAIKAKGIQTQQNEEAVQQLMPLYTNLINKGKYNEANQLAISFLYNKNPEIAKALINSNVTAKDQYSEFNTEKKMDKNFANSKDLAEFQFDLQQAGADNEVVRYGSKLALTNKSKFDYLDKTAKMYISLGIDPKEAYRAAFMGGSKSANANASAVTSQQYQAANAIIKDKNDWEKSHFNGEPWPGSMQDYNAATQIVQTAMYGGAQNVPQKAGNTSSIDYYDAESDWTAALKTNQQKGGAKKWSRLQMISRAKELYGDLADNIIKNTEWKAFGL